MGNCYGCHRHHHHGHHHHGHHNHHHGYHVVHECEQDVLKCARFFKNLLRRSQRQSPQLATLVWELIICVIYGSIGPEEFVIKLQEMFHSQAEPKLLPFLKKTLPLLRSALQSGQVTINGLDGTRMPTCVRVQEPIGPVERSIPQPQVQQTQQPQQIQVAISQPEQQSRLQAQIEQDVHKCARFFKTLIHLSQKKSLQLATLVRELVICVIYGPIGPEEFIIKLEEMLHSQAQPNLLPFLQKTLPFLRSALQSGQVTIDGLDGTTSQSEIPTSVRVQEPIVSSSGESQPPYNIADNRRLGLGTPSYSMVRINFLDYDLLKEICTNLIESPSTKKPSIVDEPTVALNNFLKFPLINRKCHTIFFNELGRYESVEISKTPAIGKEIYDYTGQFIDELSHDLKLEYLLIEEFDFAEKAEFIHSNEFLSLSSDVVDVSPLFELEFIYFPTWHFKNLVAKEVIINVYISNPTCSYQEIVADDLHFNDIEARTNPHIEKLEFKVYGASLFQKDGWKLMLTDFSKCLPNLQILTYEQSWFASYGLRDDENDGEDDSDDDEDDVFFKYILATCINIFSYFEIGY
uniref:TAFH domain-containing protein n=1 Tax=Acrobeloides nanus TaxID=290746 RepID=A0A914DM35_9BILA